MSHSEKTSHKEVVTEMARNLKVLSMRLTEIEHLGNSEHSEYQEQWRNFYNRYGKAIVKYILIQARWGDQRIYDAQDIAQLVYQKALLGKNFKSKENEEFREIVKKVGFRVIIRRLVKDVLSDYFRKIGSDRHPVLLEDIEKADELTPLTQAIDKEAIAKAKKILETYAEKEKKVLQWIWDHGKWPKSKELVGMILCSNEEAARQWKSRHKDLWENFQRKITKDIE